MRRATTLRRLGGREASRLAAVADALAAAEAAAQLARDMSAWSARSGAGADETAEAAAAAARARRWADQARLAGTSEDAWLAGRAAWAAVASIVEADERLNAAIADRLAAG